MSAVELGINMVMHVRNQPFPRGWRKKKTIGMGLCFPSSPSSGVKMKKLHGLENTLLALPYPCERQAERRVGNQALSSDP